MSKHPVSAVITSWFPTNWQLSCGCGDRWTGATYESAEDFWRMHVLEVTGRVLEPMGDQSDRWQPPAMTDSP